MITCHVNVYNVTCILLALGKPSYALLPATSYPKAVGGVWHATITDYTVCKHSTI